MRPWMNAPGTKGSRLTNKTPSDSFCGVEIGYESPYKENLGPLLDKSVLPSAASPHN